MQMAGSNPGHFCLLVIACDKREAFTQGSVSDDPPSLAARAMARLKSTEALLRVSGSNPVVGKKFGLLRWRSQ
jgi:hypothetical protein